ncbi:MAG: hypothetical protein FIA99_02555 [Ruminiclostridium sp.]|nr:hypothetical protein [Ruminiclostridium sp.]
MKILSDNDVEMLSESVCKVLEKTGLNCESDEMLKAYALAGAHVDYEQNVAKFPKAVIQKFAEELKNEDKSGWDSFIQGNDRMVIYSGYIPYNDDIYLKEPPVPFMFHNLSTYFYDDEKRERRLGNVKDFIELIKFGEGLHPKSGMGHVLNLVEGVAPEVEPLEAALLLQEFSGNPAGVYVHDVKQIEYLREIEDIFGIRDPFWHWMANIPCSSPLKLEKTVADRYVYMLKTGIYPAKLTAMPVSGVNIPITAAGSIVIVAAEFIALWLAARVIQEKKIPLVGMPISGTMDIRKGDISFSAFDAVRVRLGICDLIRTWTGVRLAPGPGEWVPTKLPGLYNTLEKAYQAMTFAAFTGYHPDIGAGHLDSGLAISPVQMLLDTEFSKTLKYLERPLVDQETLGMDAILEIGLGREGNFLTQDHTLKHMKSSPWIPELLARNGWSPEVEEELLGKAIRKVNEIKASYIKPEGRGEGLAKARTVIERARKELCR